MSIRTVMAVLYFATPDGGVVKHVNWSGFEARAMLVTSISSKEAFDRFLINAKRIIKVSGEQLNYLKTIWFYEESRTPKGELKRDNPTLTIVIGDNMDHLDVVNDFC